MDSSNLLGISPFLTVVPTYSILWVRFTSALVSSSSASGFGPSRDEPGVCFFG